MQSELFQALGTSANQQNQSPRDAAMNLLRQRGISIPDGLANSPQGIIQHLMQSGQIPQGRLQMAQQMLQRMMHR